MIAAKELKGRWLACADKGVKLGEIKEVYLTPDAAEVFAVQIGTTGLLRRKTWLVPASEIQLFGQDVWLVADDSVVVEQAEFEKENQLLAASELRGREISTTEGTQSGIILDTLLTPEMKVSGFKIGKLEKDSPLAKSKLISLESVVDLGDKSRPIQIDLNKAVLPIGEE